MNFEIADCKRCGRSGSYGGRACEGCHGAGTAVIASPATYCIRCGGSGSYGGLLCEGCEGCGWAHRYEQMHRAVRPAASLASEGTPAVAATTVQLNHTMNNLIAEIGSVAYFTGVFISMGMNFALGNGLGALLLCWLSWVNVGYALVNLLAPGATPSN